MVTTNAIPRELYSAPVYEDKTDSFEDGQWSLGNIK